MQTPTIFADRDGVFITLVANIAEIVQKNGPRLFSEIGNMSMRVNDEFRPVSELLRTYGIRMGDLAAYLQVHQLASVLGNLGTTTFVPYNPSFPTWVVQLKVKRVVPPIQPTMAESSDVSKHVSAIHALLEKQCIGDDGMLASKFGLVETVKAHTLAHGKALKDIIALIPGYKMTLATEGSCGTATIYREKSVAVPEA